MYGAILGDIIGSPYEFDRGNKTKNFPLFSQESKFTDDSVMTIAVAEALLKSGHGTDDEIRRAVTLSMRIWGNRYPDAGYGQRFHHWLHAKAPKPYGSYGNGSAMRVSPVGWLYESIGKTREVARLTAEVTHNHPEGIKGAEATASAIFLARTGHSKTEIRDYITQEFGYDLSRTCDDIRPVYRHDESCQRTVPEAIIAFLEGNGFEDVIRTAVSLGGDCDTLTCIAGGIAEAFYGVPVILEAECKARVTLEMADVLLAFDRASGRRADEDDAKALRENRVIEEAITALSDETNKDAPAEVLVAIQRRMDEDGCLIVPVELPPEAADMFDLWRLRVGDTVTSQQELHMKLRYVHTEDNQTWIAAFTSQYERDRGDATSSVICPIRQVLEDCVKLPLVAGIAINPWGRHLLLTKDAMRLILGTKIPKREIHAVELVCGDITCLETEAVVNATDRHFSGGGGVDRAIHLAAGSELAEACKMLKSCEVGDAMITDGFGLKARYIIHTAGPKYHGKEMDERYLHSCYYRVLDLARDRGIRSIAFPVISLGTNGFPQKLAAEVALKAISHWFEANPAYRIQVVICCNDALTYDIIKKTILKFPELRE